MEKLNTTLVVWVALVALLLLWVRTWRFDDPQITKFELQRHRGARDPELRRLTLFVDNLPLLRALRSILTALLLVAVVLLAIGAWGAGWGLVLAVLIVYVVEVLAGVPALVRAGGRAYLKAEPGVFWLVRHVNMLLHPLQRDSEQSTVTTFYSKDELRDLVNNDRSVLSDHDKRLISQALLYDKTRVGDIMTSRRVIETVAAGDTLGPIQLDKLHQTKLDKFPVIDGDLDSIVGVLYLHHLPEKSRTAKRMHEVMQREVYYVRDDWPLDELFAAILQTNSHLFIVVSETNKVVGLVTMTDVLRHMLGRKLNASLPDYEDRAAVAKD